MDATLARRIEMNVDRAASVLLGAAAGVSGFSWSKTWLETPLRTLVACLMGAALATFCLRSLSAIKADLDRFPLAAFEPREIEIPEELLLTEDDRLDNPGAQAPEPLELQDVLAQINADSRVVRLFDPSAMPTPGQLKASIDRHLDSDEERAHIGDASEALHDALAELRRSLH